MPVPRMRGPNGGPSLNTLEFELKQYIKQLTAIQETIYAQERAREQENPEKAPIETRGFGLCDEIPKMVERAKMRGSLPHHCNIIHGIASRRK